MLLCERNRGRGQLPRLGKTMLYACTRPTVDQEGVVEILYSSRCFASDTVPTYTKAAFCPVHVVHSVEIDSDGVLFRPLLLLYHPHWRTKRRISMSPLLVFATMLELLKPSHGLWLPLTVGKSGEATCFVFLSARRGVGESLRALPAVHTFCSLCLR